MAMDLSTFGSGLGGVIGSGLAMSDLNSAQSNISNIANNFIGQTQPYNQFGQSFLNPATSAINRISGVAGADPNLNYNTFMSNYQTSPAAKYEMGVADAAQNSSAAANGGLLSGANERALSGINTGITSTYANNAYTNYLQGNQQQFGQLQSALSNMFQGIGVGTTATGQQESMDASQMYANSQIAQAQAKNDQSFGSGLGTLFSGLKFGF
jgi:hypothetical protein